MEPSLQGCDWKHRVSASPVLGALEERLLSEAMRYGLGWS